MAFYIFVFFLFSSEESVPLVAQSEDEEDESLFELSGGNVKESRGPNSDGGTLYTVEEAVESIGFGWFQLRLYFVCGVISVRKFCKICFRYMVHDHQWVTNMVAGEEGGEEEKNEK